MQTPQRRRPVVPSTCRCLFGAPDANTTTVHAELERRLNRRNRERWNFDFRSSEPVTSTNHCRYDWAKLGRDEDRTIAARPSSGHISPSNKRIPLTPMDNSVFSVVKFSSKENAVGSRRWVSRQSPASFDAEDDDLLSLTTATSYWETVDEMTSCDGGVVKERRRNDDVTLRGRENRKRKSHSILGKDDYCMTLRS